MSTYAPYKDSLSELEADMISSSPIEPSFLLRGYTMGTDYTLSGTTVTFLNPPDEDMEWAPEDDFDIPY